MGNNSDTHTVALAAAIAAKFGLDRVAAVTIGVAAVYVLFGDADEPSKEAAVNWEPSEPELQALAVALASRDPQAFAESKAHIAREMLDATAR